MRHGKGSAFDYLQIGLELAASALLGLFAGMWLDSRFGTGPWCVLCGSALGIGIGLYNAIRQALK
ncbi:MAG: AtpZ/AtpI family protein [Elusimicrobiaceae bacterium]|nr:AtpZ/AtpI family protein [Elusimicrobiaceae bacterium]